MYVYNVFRPTVHIIGLVTRWGVAVACAAVGFVVFVRPGIAQSKSSDLQRPEIYIQSGHPKRITVLAVSQDGVLAATADASDGDGTIKLWQISTDRQLRNLVTTGGDIDVLTFSADRRLLASHHSDETIRIWETATGRELYRFYVPDQAVDRLVISPDGRFLASFPSSGAGLDRERDPELSRCPDVPHKPGFCESHDISIWDIEAGQFRYAIKAAGAEHKAEMHGQLQFAFSQNSQLLAAGVDGHAISIVRVADGSQLPPLPSAVPPFIFDREGKRMASRFESGSVAIWEMRTSRRIATITTESVPKVFLDDGTQLITVTDAAGVYTLHYWDLKTLAELNRISLGREYQCEHCYLRVAPDGRWAARGGFEDPKLALWDLSHPDSKPQLWYGLSAPVEFSSDDKYLIAMYEKRIWRLDTRTGAQDCSTASNFGKNEALALSSSAAWLATGSGGNIALWALDTGVLSKKLSGHTEPVTSLKFVSNSTRLISGASPSAPMGNVTWLPGIMTDSLKVTALPTWNKPSCADDSLQSTGERLESAQGAIWDPLGAEVLHQMNDFRSPVAVSLDGRLTASGVDGHAWIRMWNTDDGNQVREPLDDSVPGKPEGDATGEIALAFSPDGRILASASRQSNDIRLWDLKTFQRSVLPGHTNSLTALAFDPATKLLASAGLDKTVRLWDTATRQQVYKWKLENPAEGMTYSRDGKRLAIATGEYVIEYDNSGRELNRFVEHAKALQYTNDGTLLLTASGDGPTRLWDAQNGKQLATMVSFANGQEWLVTTPDGLFDGSPGAWSAILWRFGGNPLDVQPVESYFSEYFHPGLLAEIIKGGRPAAPVSIEKRDRRQPEVKFLGIGGQQAQPTASISRMLEGRLGVTEAPADKDHPNRGSGVKDVRLFRNGSLVKVWHGVKQLDAQGQIVLPYELPIVAGENHLTAYAFNNDNIKSADAALTVTGTDMPNHRGVAYILAFGINEYASARPMLKFAVNDATDFASTLEHEQIKLTQFERTCVIRLTDRHATKQNILSALNRLAGIDKGPLRPSEPPEFQNIQPAQPEDAVFIYFAGHGDAPGKESKRFYLIAQDYEPSTAGSIASGGGDATVPGAINDLELASVFENMDAKYIVLVIDACKSGMSLESDDPRQGPMNSQGLAQLAYEKGMYILAAAQSDQAALELSEYDHGLLTYALVEKGLKQGTADDAPRDGQILLREWLDYPTLLLPQLQLDGMKRMAAQGRDISIVRSVSVVGVPPEHRETQRPRVFYRREPEATPIVVSKPTAVKSSPSAPK